jgi:hypothetical protein
MTPCIPGLISNHWWKTNKSMTFLSWFTRFIYERGWYTLAIHYQQGDLIINTQNKQVNLYKASQLPMLPKLSTLPIYDLTFRSTQSSLLPYQSLLTYNFNQCWTMNDLDESLVLTKEIKQNEIKEQSLKKQVEWESKQLNKNKEIELEIERLTALLHENGGTIIYTAPPSNEDKIYRFIS